MAAACVYTVCRQDAKPFMLIDFSDALHVNVYVAGRRVSAAVPPAAPG